MYTNHHHEAPSSESSATHSPVSVESPYTFSPGFNSTNPASYVSNATNFTTPPSSTSLTSNPPLPYPLQHPTLSYPSVPPPSLSSSLGSPIIPYHTATGGVPDPLDLGLNHHRRNSSARRRGSTTARVAETGSLRDISENRSRSRRESMDRSLRYSTGTGNSASASTSTTITMGVPQVPTTSSPIPIRAPHNASREGTPVNR